MHTDAAQALGKISVSAHHLGVDFLTIVGHKVWNVLRKWSDAGIGTDQNLSYICSSMALGSALSSWTGPTREHRCTRCCLEEDRSEASDPGS